LWSEGVLWEEEEEEEEECGGRPVVGYSSPLEECFLKIDK
jgi:hypothetical protein